MKQFVNTDKIIEAFISEPYTNAGESWDFGITHGWEVHLIMGYTHDGQGLKVIIGMENEQQCIEKLHFLGLIQVN